MFSPGILRSCLLLLLLVTVGFSPASAQWMFEKKPTAKGSAFEVAYNIPANALFVTGFQLKNQVDLKGLSSEIRLAAQKSKDAKETFEDIEKHLGMPFPQWVGLFNGRGFLALLETQGIAPSDSWVLALQLEKPSEARDWFKTRYFADKKPTSIRGFEVYDFDGTEFGVGKSWVFLTRTRGATESLTLTLSGAPGSLATETTFQKAQGSLTGGHSGLFFYLNGDSARSVFFPIVELPAEHPATESLGFWEFAVLSFDFAKEEADGFLGYTQRDGKVSAALRRPGRVSAGLFDLLPGGLSSAWAGDAGWAYRVTEAFGDEIPEIGMLLGFAHSALNEYGDFEAAFTGTMVSGSNALDMFAQFLEYEFVMSRHNGQLVECSSNLKNIATALEMYGVDNDGQYPDELKDLSSEYLVRVPICPTAGAKPYAYTRAEAEGTYLVSCVGHQHPLLNPGFPRYSSTDGILEEYDKTSSSAAVVNAAAEEPSMVVVMPVENVSETHNLMQNAVESNKKTPVDECGINLSTLAYASESYAAEHDGVYPKALTELAPEYVSELPKCPVAERDTYSGSYSIVEGERAGVKLFCQGHNHPELETDKPSYDSTSDEGLVTGPVKALPADQRRPAPEKGTTATYDVESGPKGELNSGTKTLRLAYGPRASELLTASSGRLSENSFVAESLKWGNDAAIYIDYFNLGPLYTAALSALDKGAASGSEEAAVTADILRAMRARVQSLEGSSCLKVTDRGLHLRSRGVGSSQLMGGFVVATAAVGVPNFAKARSQGQLSACKSNLKNIGTALEMWSVDNNGEYPKSMAVLAPGYLRMIPTCPAAEADTYSETYRLIKSEEHGYTYYEVYCKGSHHERVGCPENYPRYNGESGLMETPLEP